MILNDLGRERRTSHPGKWAVRRSIADTAWCSSEVRSVTDNAEAWVSSSHRPMGFPEFVVVVASIMALNPLAMDMMLPALPNIASAFDITIANERHEADECTMRDHPHANAANETGIEKAS